jgi:hypothetical protein
MKPISSLNSENNVVYLVRRDAIMPNRLAAENSPYLAQHAENPVDWFPWGAEALEKARQEDKPIFLSIGYAACHWCHVMAHESFEDPETAAVMNRYFVNIKVDREERPDLDSIYMDAIVALTGHGGWPMSAFLTPDGHPFFGGTYFPPVARFNMPAFRDVLLGVARAWQNERPKLLEYGQQLTSHVTAINQVNREVQPVQEQLLTQAAMTLVQQYDWKDGGWGKAPKFPQPMSIEYLLRRASLGDGLALETAEHALQAMAKGGMYDVVGGGFARYSTDNAWLVPHFEKMLYDNAQLALVYLHAHLLTGKPEYRRVCEETLDFILRELTHPEGGFYSSLDADSEGEEGKYYTWTQHEIATALQSKELLDLASMAYAISPQGNWEGKIVLQRAVSDEALAERLKLPASDVPTRLGEIHRQLFAARSRRVRPTTDDKVLVAWNALALIALAEGGRYLGNSDYTQAAVRNADFILRNLRTAEGRLQRSWRAANASHLAYLEDYAGLALGLLALYQADHQARWFSAAQTLVDEMLSLFRDKNGGFFDTGKDHEKLLVRPKSIQDNATPCGNSLAAQALLCLYAFTGDARYLDPVDEMWGLVAAAIGRYPTAFAHWLTALDFALSPVQELAILGVQGDERTQALIAASRAAYLPRLVVAVSVYPPETGSPALLADRPLLDGKPTAYLCQRFVCQKPVHTPQELQSQLQEEVSRS